MWILLLDSLASSTLAQAQLPCSDTANKTLPSGLGCKDKWDSVGCVSLFETAAKAGEARSAMCSMDALVNLASENCPLTCGYCCESPEYKCDNVPFFESGIDCTKMADKCGDAPWREIISRFCPSTCGMCLEGGCIDIANGCTPDMCFNVNLLPFAHVNCARTCGKCPPKAGPTTTKAPPGPENTPATAPAPSGPCVDLDYNCAARTRGGKFCNDSSYQSEWFKCLKSCGRC